MRIVRLRYHFVKVRYQNCESTVLFPLVRLDLHTVGHRDCLALVARGVIQALGTMEF